MNWISTRDRMPENKSTVLAIDVSCDVAVAEVIDGSFFAVAFGFDAYEDDASYMNGPSRITSPVTHWMPLPETPTL